MKPETVHELIESYVRGELPLDEAERFEEQYFQDEELARLVEAEQLLVRGEGLAGLDAAGDAARDTGERPSAARQPESAWHRALRVYSYAAAILLVPMALLLFQNLERPSGVPDDLGRSAAVGGVTGLGVTVGQVRLSATRSSAPQRPPFRFWLPDSPSERIELVLPALPEATGETVLSLHGGDAAGDEPLWETTLPATQGAAANITLPGGSLSPGRYRIVQQDLAGDVIGVYEFEIVERE